MLYGQNAEKRPVVHMVISLLYSLSKSRKKEIFKYFHGVMFVAAKLVLTIRCLAMDYFVTIFYILEKIWVSKVAYFMPIISIWRKDHSRLNSSCARLVVTIAGIWTVQKWVWSPVV
jgi:hypothetical protein